MLRALLDRLRCAARDREIRRIYLTALAAMLATAALGTGMILHHRGQALAEAAVDLRTLARAVAKETERSFQAVDLVLTGIAERLPPGSGLAGYPLHEMLREKKAGLPQIDNLALVDAAGDLLATSRVWPAPTMNLADRDYFRELRESAGERSVIAEPVLSRGDGSWSLVVARRLEGPGTEFRGLAVAVMAIDRFAAGFADLLGHNSETIALVRRDDLLLAHYPPTEQVGRRDSRFTAALGASGMVLQDCPVTGVPSIVAAVPVQHFPLMVRATVAERTALADWRAQALAVLAAMLAIVAAFAVAAEAWARHLLDLRRVAEARAETARTAAVLGLQRERLAALEAVEAARAAAERARAEAEAASRAKSDFLAMMSHELRTPLNAVIGFSEIMSAELFGSLGNPTYRNYAEDIAASGQHLLAVINDILDISKIEAGRMELRAVTVDLTLLVAEAVQLIRVKAEQGGLHLVERPARGPVLVQADPQKLRQVLLNLLSNAVKFTPRGGQVEIALEILPDGARCTVRDTGIGIPAADMKNVLRPFFQVDSSLARKQEGTGLGLPLARALMELHGGSLTIESTEGRGTTVAIFLPRAAALPASGRTIAAEAAA